MFAEFLQYVFVGLTIGAIYALVALGFAIIYNASHVINFAQGEFIMIGGMSAAALIAAGLPLWLAAPGAVVVVMIVGVALERCAVGRARNASVTTLIIITIGASIFLRGLVEWLMGKEIHAIPAFSGEAPILVAGATLAPQSLWVLGSAGAAILGLWYFFNRTLHGKAMLATSHNRLAAQLVGIAVKRVLLLSFALSAMLGAVAGIVITPITFTYSEAGIMLGLKGFSAAVLGGLGSGPGAVVGGLVVGLSEAFAAGYISSAYKDAVAFIIILLVLFFLPNGLFGKGGTDRV